MTTPSEPRNTGRQYDPAARAEWLKALGNSDLDRAEILKRLDHLDRIDAEGQPS